MGNWELSTHHVNNNPSINDDALYCQEQLIDLTIQQVDHTVLKKYEKRHSPNHVLLTL